MQSKLKEAVLLLKAGKKDQAREILNSILEENPNNEAAWIWMSQAVTTKKEKQYCLEQLLVRNPQHSPETTPAEAEEQDRTNVDQDSRRFTAAEVKAIRKSYQSSALGFLAGKNARPSAELAKRHHLNEAQIFAIRSLAKEYHLSDEEVASKLHLLTEQMQTANDVAEVYGIALK